MKKKHLFAMALTLAAMLLSGCGRGAAPEPTPQPTPEPTLYTVDVEIECVENLLFSKYDVTVLMDDVELGTLDHGTTGTFTAQVEAGKHTLSVQKENDSGVDGSVSFSVEEDIALRYKISCSSSQVSIEQIIEPEETPEPPAEEIPSPENEQTPTPAPEPTAAGTPAPEAAFPQETAKRAAVVAMTNGQADDVFAADGNTYDPALFHSYADTSGFYMIVCDDGIWTAKSEDTWHVEGLKLRIHGYDTYVKATLDVTFNGSEYVVSGVRRVLGSEDALDTEDPSKSSVEEWEPSDMMPFLMVPSELVAEERTTPATGVDDAEVDTKPSAVDPRQEWIESQFSFWDGAHKDLEKLIKKSLNDEKSYKHIETKYTDVNDEVTQALVNQILESAGYSQRVEVGDLFISTEFSAKNLFNATVKKTAYGISSYANNTIELIGIE